MTEVTRIACPGCRISLQFKPEALDFPANCAACDCRFAVGIYVRLSCPKCHQGSKIRESYRGRCVRCNRCQHDFVSDEGIAAGPGGRMLVARMLDTGAQVPPETIQPFASNVTSVTSDVVRGHDPGSIAVSGSGIWQVPRILDLERLRGEPEGPRPRQSGELVASRKAAKEADERWSTAEGKLVEAMLELGEAEQRISRLISEHAEALRTSDLERSALLSRLDRLTAAVASAAAGEAEADRLAEEALRKFDAVLDDLRSEQRKRLELARAAEELKAEVETLRVSEATKASALAELQASRHEADASAASVHEESRKLADRLEEARDAEARIRRELVRGTEAVEKLLVENRALAEELESLRADHRRMRDEAGRTSMQREQEARTMQEGARLREENRRLRAAIEQARLGAELLQGALAIELDQSEGDPGRLRGDRLAAAVGLDSTSPENGYLHRGEAEAMLESS